MPSAVAATRTRWRWPRPCIVSRFSVRVWRQVTGRPSSRAMRQGSTYSGSSVDSRRPPPTAGAITCTARARARTAPRSRRASRAAPAVRRGPRPSPSGSASTARVSSGTTPTRWFVISTSTTTAAPSANEPVDAARASRLRAVDPDHGVGVEAGVEPGRVGGERGVEIRDDREGFVVDLDQLGGVGRRALVGRRDHRDDLADEPDDVAGAAGGSALLERARRSGRARHRGRRRCRRPPRPVRRGLRPSRSRARAPVRDGGAHEREGQDARTCVRDVDGDVAGEARRTGQQRAVLDAPARLPTAAARFTGVRSQAFVHGR